MFAAHATGSDSKRSTVDAGVLRIFDQSLHATLVSDHDFCDLKWYPTWLSRQLLKLPSDYIEKSCCQLFDTGSDRCGEPFSAPLAALDTVFWKVWLTVSEFVSSEGRCVIDEVIEHLVQAEKLFNPNVNDPHVLFYQRYLLFAVLGWQSMLYLPSFSSDKPTELVLYQDINQPHSGLVFDTFKISIDLTDREMAILLKGYGNLLPARPPELAKVASETSKVASAWSPLAPAEMNIDVLSTVLHVRIHWVETIALHLDYDQATRTLSLFRFPSFCVATLRSEGTLYSFASTIRHSADPRANREDITDIMKETLSSYRLLFGQSKHSRQFFRRQVYRNSPELFANGDKLLPMLCSEKRFEHDAVPQDRPIYFAERDFPVLGPRIRLIIEELKEAKPKSWMELLRDRRNITQYWTFWLVAIFGAISIILGIVQVVLQGLALK